MKLILSIFLFSLLLIVSVAPVLAQQTPIVQLVFFFNPDCENCQQLLTRDLPPLQSKYGSQLEILQIDTSKPDGIRLYQSMAQHFQLTRDRLGTPAIVLGTTVLVGADEIPAKLPGLIDINLANGGVIWPDIPGLSPFITNLEKSDPYPYPGPTTAIQKYPQPSGPSLAVGQSSETSIWGRFASNFKKDIPANSLAVIILVCMLISVVVILAFLIRNVLAENTISSGIKIPWWIIPLLIFIGIGIAGYLTSIEIGKKPALCGPVGHCNEVQNSPYAKLFGILPVGVLGLFGYAALLIAWGTKMIGPKRLRTPSIMALWGMSLFGVAFSIYLTFLEPFVIGTACIWCLSSALIITVLLWVTTPGLQEILTVEDDTDDDQLELTGGSSG